jgi:hypothetical protein
MAFILWLYLTARDVENSLHIHHGLDKVQLYFSAETQKNNESTRH